MSGGRCGGRCTGDAASILTLGGWHACDACILEPGVFHIITIIISAYTNNIQLSTGRIWGIDASLGSKRHFCIQAISYSKRAYCSMLIIGG